MAIPIFIHNGHLFLTDLGIFVDGMVDCWGMVDLDGFRAKLAEGWVRTEGYLGSRLSIHGLGVATIDSGQNRMTQELLIEIVEKTVDILKRDPKVPNKPGGPGSGFRPCRDDENDQPIWCEKLSLFCKAEESYKLVRWFIYADGWSHLDKEELEPLGKVIDKIRSGDYSCSLPEGAELELGILGAFGLVNGKWQTSLEDRISEARDLLCQLRGLPGLVEQCLQRFQDYLKQPDGATKAALLQAYEAVPSHKRHFCGDQDVQDIPIRMALYGREEIERWSHRQLARKLGHEDLPEIDVPILEG